jgi:hypothetical protein
MKKLFLLAALPLASLTAVAQAGPEIEESLTPAQYFACQIGARQASIQSLQERLERSVSKPGLTRAERRAADTASESRVLVAMYSCGKQTPSTLGAYGHRNAELLQTWLYANPQVKNQIDALNQRITSYALQLAATPLADKR